ncbi:hypothetical protein C8J57DRAFT_1235037 [Mycena rebaudengoi]|nr:hypothetical protein C8J57DRAFT_1235037 [Mycena rebaudengoi]
MSHVIIIRIWIIRRAGCAIKVTGNDTANCRQVALGERGKVREKRDEEEKAGRFGVDGGKVGHRGGCVATGADSVEFGNGGVGRRAEYHHGGPQAGCWGTRI